MNGKTISSTLQFLAFSVGVGVSVGHDDCLLSTWWAAVEIMITDSLYILHVGHIYLSIYIYLLFISIPFPS